MYFNYTISAVACNYCKCRNWSMASNRVFFNEFVLDDLIYFYNLNYTIKQIWIIVNNKLYALEFFGGSRLNIFNL